MMFKRLLSLTLVVLLLTDPLRLLAANRDDDNKDLRGPGYYRVDQQTGEPRDIRLEGLISVIEKQDFQNPKYIGADPDGIIDQTHYIYSKDGKTVVKAISLNKLDVSNEPVGVNANQLRTVYNPQSKELIIQKVEAVKGADGQMTLIPRHGHSIPRQEITSNIVDNPLFIAYATPEGVKIILKALLYPSLFLSGVPNQLLIPAPPIEGAKIIKVDFLSRENGDQELFNKDPFINTGDMAVTVELPGGSIQTEKISQDELSIALGTRLTLTYGMAQLANGDLSEGSTDFLLNIVNQYSNELQAYGDTIGKSPSYSQEKLRSAYVNIGQRDSSKVLRNLLTKNSAGQNSFEALANADRDTYSREELQKAKANPPPAKPVQEKPTVYKRIISYLTPKRLIMLSMVLGGYAADAATGGNFKVIALNAIAAIIEHANNVQGLNLLTESMVNPKTGKALEFFYENWAVTRAAVGTGVVLAFYPLSLWAGQLVSKLKGYSLGKAKAFFTEGIRLYGLANYPIQKLVWEYVGRQQNLYAALDVDHLSGAAWNPPSASPQDIKDRANKIAADIDTQAAQKEKARLIAARAISKRFDVDLGSLLMMSFGKKLSALADMVSNPAETLEKERWERVSSLSQTTLAQMARQENDPNPADPKQIQQFEKSLAPLAAQLDQAKKSPLAPALNALKEKGQLFARWSSRLFLFGSSNLRLYRQYRDVNLDDHTVEIADEAYKDDYIASSVIYAATDGPGFADISRLGPHAPEIGINQGEQVFIYGMQGATDALTAQTSTALELPAEQKPITNKRYEEGEGEENPLIRGQTIGEGLKAIGSTIANPGTLGHFKNHQNYMRNLLEGFQVRTNVGGLLRFVGLWGTVTAAAHLTGHHIPIFPNLFFAAMIIQSWFLIDKISFQPNGGFFRPGYAAVWPYVHLAMRQMLGVATGNLDALQKADYNLDTGLRFNNRDLIEKGIELTQNNFSNGRQLLPEKFRVTPNEYTVELANGLLEYARANVPLPTKANPTIKKILNVVIGAVISTALYTKMSHTAYNPDNLGIASNLAILGKTLAYFGVTYVALGAAQMVSTPIIKTIKDPAAQFAACKEKLKSLFQKRSGVN